MSRNHPWFDKARPVTERLDCLMRQMSRREKIGQMTQLDARQNPERWIRDWAVGSFLHTMGEKNAHLQQLAAETRLGIPLIFGIDAIHGHAFYAGATVFPTQLALSCSWNSELAEAVACVTARDVRASGVHWTFSPVLCMARDLRWGRVDETFGEDPLLIAELAEAMVRGYQGEKIGDPERILACAKHFAGYSETRGGRDSTEADLTERRLHSEFLPPFERVARAGCATFMTAYQAIDGVPCTTNRKLLTELLKNQWGLQGFVVTDWNNIGSLHTLQRTCATMEEAAAAGVEAGNDMIMQTPDFPEAAMRAAENGELSDRRIDDACRRILKLKFQLGLFDGPAPPTPPVHLQPGRPEDRELALEAACQSLVLLKNENQLLPLNAGNIRNLAVIGPNADDVQAQLGDWAYGSGQAEFNVEGCPREQISTVLDGIRRHLSPECHVHSARGCDTIAPDTTEIADAAKLAAQADVVILVLGDALPLIGEGHDRADLNLSDAQQQLLDAVLAGGTPVVLILISSKPLTIARAARTTPAIIQAFNPGMCGGEAIAAILFGDRNPCGKLSISVPHHVGQQPVCYRQPPGWHGERYVDLPKGPLFAFGFGLSYTRFEYTNLNIHPIVADNVPFSVDLTNVGEREGVEIVQAYVNDLFSSVTTPEKELKLFRRVTLKPGESRHLDFSLPIKDLALINAAGDKVVEPGEFELMIGGSSRDEDLLRARFSL